MALAEENLKVLAISTKQQLDTRGGWGQGDPERLASKRGADFDREFYEEVKLSSSDGYRIFDQAFREIEDAQIREFAKNWYPIMRNYPRDAIRLEKELGKKRK